jgi:hypothetical protein
VLLFAHHSAVVALPAFAPVLVVCAALLVHTLRNRSGRGRGDA